MPTRTEPIADGDKVEPADPIGDRRLMTAATIFTAAVIFHGFDHLRRGTQHLPRDVFWLGTLGMVTEVAVVVLIAQRHRWAPLAAAAGGAVLAAGYFAVHFLPRHPWFSDSFTSAVSVSPLSWLAATAEILTACALATTGVMVFRERGGPVAVAGERDLASAIRTPVAAIMIVGNVVLLAVSLVQLAG